MTIKEYATKNGYRFDIEALTALVKEWSNGNFSDTLNDLYASKLREMFGNSPIECFEEFIGKPGLAEELFESLEWYAVQDSEDDSDWDYGSYDYDVAYNMANECKKRTGFARIVTIDDGECPVAIKEEII